MLEGPASEGARVGRHRTQRQQPFDHAPDVELATMDMQLDYILTGERARPGHPYHQRILCPTSIG